MGARPCRLSYAVGHKQKGIPLPWTNVLNLHARELITLSQPHDNPFQGWDWSCLFYSRFGVQVKLQHGESNEVKQV